MKPLLLFRCLVASLGVLRSATAEMFTPQAELDLQNGIFRTGKELLYRGDFKEIERIGTDYLAKRDLHPSSVWKLRHFSDSITHPRDQKDPKDWEFLIGKWEEWDNEFGSAFSRSMLGKAYLNHAKNARGDDFASEVPEEQWPKMEERLAKAVAVLQDAKKRAPKDPEVYRNLLHAGILQGWPRKKMDDLVKEAIAVAPGYYDCHYNMCYYLMERWHGDEGDWQRYANSLPSRIEGDDAYIVYSRLCAEMFQWYQDDFFAEDRPDKVSWSRMKRGFEAVMKKYPDSAINLNRYAYFAWLAKDRDTAREKLKMLDQGGLIFDRAWDAKERVEAARKWVAEVDGK